MVTNYTIITPMQYPGQTETEPFARVHVLARRHRRVLGYQPLLDVPNDDVRIGMRVARGVGVGGREGATGVRAPRATSSAGCPTGEPDVTDPDLVNRIC